MVHALLGIEDHNELAGHPVVGASWEGLVIENLLGVAPSRTQASFYRSAAGAEIDLVLDLPKRGRWAIEIKRGLATPLAKGFYLACEDLKPIAVSSSTLATNATRSGPRSRPSASRCWPRW
jgi:hypothetical protein